MVNFQIIFDDVILYQLKKAGRDSRLRVMLSTIFDKIEELGPRAGKLIDSHLFVYEIKLKSPPIRLYFKHVKDSNNIYLFEYELKTSEEKQKRTISRIKDKVRKLFS